jgi:hypothetical protein
VENQPTTSTFTPVVPVPAIWTVILPFAGLGRTMAMLDTLTPALKFTALGDAAAPPDG